jgi:xanthine dehydrogenase molybdopterin-binding subunit B
VSRRPVLAVLADCEDSAQRIAAECNGDPRALLYAVHVAEARAAVAELIEAAKAQRDSVTMAQEKEATTRLYAALARAQP